MRKTHSTRGLEEARILLARVLQTREVTGPHMRCGRYTRTLRRALGKARIEDRVRPFHDGRHTSITSAAAAGLSPVALMARSGHADFKTTQGYIDLAGERFREEAERAEERLLGGTSTKNRYKASLRCLSSERPTRP